MIYEAFLALISSRRDRLQFPHRVKIATGATIYLFAYSVVRKLNNILESPCVLEDDEDDDDGDEDYDDDEDEDAPLRGVN